MKLDYVINAKCGIPLQDVNIAGELVREGYAEWDRVPIADSAAPQDQADTPVSPQVGASSAPPLPPPSLTVSVRMWLASSYATGA